MSEESLIPIAKDADQIAPIGRQADLLALGLAALGTLLSFSAAIWFFLGFAENDTRPEHLVSAFVLTSLLFAFAILPFGLVAKFARQAHKYGTKRGHLLWTLFLMLPWIGLGSLTVSHTPLPFWSGLIMAGLAGLLSLWALVSLVLDWNNPQVNTLVSQQNEMSDASE
jgi:multisubunit Na+/H+ antiporter MnhC subunit